jgi:hypothetical protein
MRVNATLCRRFDFPILDSRVANYAGRGRGVQSYRFRAKGDSGLPEYLRQDNEPPAAIARHGWRYHHIGIPTQIPRPDEIHVPHLHIHVAGFRTSPFGVQWMRFDPDAPYPEAVKTIPHVAFEVDNLATALVGLEVLVPPNSPIPGLKVAMILDQGAPIELMEFSAIQEPGEPAL